MSEFDRGAYTPQTDQPVSFDARRQRQSGEGRPLPLALIFSAVVLIALLVALILFYRNGVRGAGDPPQPVGTPVTAMKAPPAPQDQPSDVAIGLQVYQAPAPGDAEPVPTFTPGPEQPQPRPTVVQALPAAAPAVPNKPVQEVTPPLPTLAVKTAPLAKQPALAKVVVAERKPAPKPVTKAVIKPEPKTAAAVAATSSALVQIGAYSSDALASKGWSDIAKAFSGPMAGKTKIIVPLEKDGSMLYRTSIGGFSSRAAAIAFCDKIKAAGKTCIVKGG